MIEPQHDELHRPYGHVGLLPPLAVRQAGGSKGWVPSPRSDDRGAVASIGRTGGGRASYLKHRRGWDRTACLSLIPWRTSRRLLTTRSPPALPRVALPLHACT